MSVRFSNADSQEKRIFYVHLSVKGQIWKWNTHHLSQLWHGFLNTNNHTELQTEPSLSFHHLQQKTLTYLLKIKMQTKQLWFALFSTWARCRWPHPAWFRTWSRCQGNCKRLSNSKIHFKRLVASDEQRRPLPLSLYIWNRIGTDRSG